MTPLERMRRSYEIAAWMKWLALIVFLVHLTIWHLVDSADHRACWSAGGRVLEGVFWDDCDLPPRTP